MALRSFKATTMFPFRRRPKHSLSSLSIPSHFICPISLDLMQDPVTLPSGITYDRRTIELWLSSGHRTCPVTLLSAEFDDQLLIPQPLHPAHDPRLVCCQLLPWRRAHPYAKDPYHVPPGLRHACGDFRCLPERRPPPLRRTNSIAEEKR
ncbi:U-box domain-containing protein 21 [Dendrobium catenatum]|uniref:U-box domain-containing protein n=1 Tax=Dendrobium catenatum TaxID=906689 RepID=A0A2I0WZZ7_9ASPA|nr:U-box domain-containing protein 21 [Dendrobium catenatum]